MENKISVALAVFNEEKNIANCLKSVEGLADEIVIIDGTSNDRTVEIAKRFKAKIYIVDNPPDFHRNKQLAIEKCTGDWILQLDADERVSPELVKEIRQTIENEDNQYSGYFLPRLNWFLGRFLRKGGAYPDPVIRLFKKDKGNFGHQNIINNGITTSNVHAQIEIDGKVGYLKNNLIHYGDLSLERYLSRLNRYTSLEAENLIKLGQKTNLSQLINYMLIKPIYWFLKRYIRHKGFIDGFQGFLFALLSACHYPIIYLKMWERRTKYV